MAGNSNSGNRINHERKYQSIEELRAVQAKRMADYRAKKKAEKEKANENIIINNQK